MTGEPRRRYIRRPDRPVAAVRLSRDTDRLVYRKWGAKRRAKPDEWIVDNDGDVHSVDALGDALFRLDAAAARCAFGPQVDND